MPLINLRVTQEPLEVLVAEPDSARCTQVVLEVIMPFGGTPPPDTPPNTRLTQEVLEVAFVRTAIFPGDTVNCPDVVFVY